MIQFKSYLNFFLFKIIIAIRYEKIRKKICTSFLSRGKSTNNKEQDQNLFLFSLQNPFLFILKYKKIQTG